MSNDKRSIDDYVPVNQMLNLKPRMGPVPGEQVIPWLCIFFLSYLLCQGVFGLSWMATAMITVWGVATWWCITGDESWRFLSKFIGVPRWTRGNVAYREEPEPKPRRSVASRTSSQNKRTAQYPVRDRREGHR